MLHKAAVGALLWQATKPPLQARHHGKQDTNAIAHMERQNPGLAELGGVSATTERDPTIQPAVDYEWPVVRVGGTVAPGWLSRFTGQEARSWGGPPATIAVSHGKQAIMQAPHFRHATTLQLSIK
jgi:hypothetical protein